MPKRGEVLPWKAEFRWTSSGIKGRRAFSSSDGAVAFVEKTQEIAAQRGEAVETSVWHVDLDGTRRRVL